MDSQLVISGRYLVCFPTDVEGTLICEVTVEEISPSQDYIKLHDCLDDEEGTAWYRTDGVKLVEELN